MPELDDQISQNEATLEQLKAAVQKAEANAKLAEATWGRDKPLLKDRWVTGHQGDIDLQPRCPTETSTKNSGQKCSATT